MKKMKCTTLPSIDFSRRFRRCLISYTSFYCRCTVLDSLHKVPGANNITWIRQTGSFENAGVCSLVYEPSLLERKVLYFFFFDAHFCTQSSVTAVR